MRCCSCDQPLVGEEEGFCRPCLVVLPDIVQIPDGSSIRSVVDQVSSLRDELGDPGPSLREIWKSIDNLPKRGDIDWLYRNEQNTQDEWRWITSPPPPLELDEESIRFLSDKMAPFRNREETIGVMRNLQRGGLLPSGEYLSWSGGDWSMDGKAIEVPFVLLRDMIKSNGGRKDIDWGALLRTIDLAVTKVLEMRNPDRPTKRAQTLSPAYYLLTRRNVHLSSFSSFDSEFGRKRISSFPSDFGDASWLRTWDHGGSDRPGMLHHHIDPDEAMQHVSLSIKNGKLLFKVRRPGGVFRNIRIPPNPELNNLETFSTLPELEIISPSGTGALLKAQLSPRPSYQGQVRQVIDCVSPRNANIVGFVNGEPYYGPFHVHPTTGAKMVGVAHTTAPHAIIYDTPQESRTSRSPVVTSTSYTTVSSSVQTNVSNTTTTSQPDTSSIPQTDPVDTSSQQTSGQSYTPPPSSPPSGGGSSGSGGGSSGGGGYGGGY